MAYLQYLRDHSKTMQNKIEELLKIYKVQPVGNGYIDLIISNEHTEAFVDELTTINIVVEGLAWWCHCTKESELVLGCPHGMGGPKSIYSDGWFSEMQIPMYKISQQDLGAISVNDADNKVKSINRKILKFIKDDIKEDVSYSACMVPGLWLYVPEEWKRI